MRARYIWELSVECVFLKQKSGIKWLHEGDANAAFFHAIVNQKRSKNFIVRIKDESGAWLESADLIKTLVIDFYSKIFSSDGHRVLLACHLRSLRWMKLTTI